MIFLRKNVLIISLFVVFALPIPIALLGCLMSAMWFLSSLIKITSYIIILDITEHELLRYVEYCSKEKKHEKYRKFNQGHF